MNGDVVADIAFGLSATTEPGLRAGLFANIRKHSGRVEFDATRTSPLVFGDQQPLTDIAAVGRVEG